VQSERNDSLKNPQPGFAGCMRRTRTVPQLFQIYASVAKEVLLLPSNDNEPLQNLTL
jgi:hypothetical protein